MSGIILWALRIVVFILFAWFYAATASDSDPGTALGEGIIAAAYFYMLYYCLVLLLQPLARLYRSASRRG